MFKSDKENLFLNQLSLSLLTTPFLVGLITLDALSQGIIELSQSSEEVFRGDRLPILNFPE